MDIAFAPEFVEALAQALLEARGHGGRLAERAAELEALELSPGEAASQAADEAFEHLGLRAALLEALAGEPAPATRLVVRLAGMSGEALRLYEENAHATLSLSPEPGAEARAADLVARWRAAVSAGSAPHKIAHPAALGGTPGCAAGTATPGFDRGGPLLDPEER